MEIKKMLIGAALVSVISASGWVGFYHLNALQENRDRRKAIGEYYHGKLYQYAYDSINGPEDQDLDYQIESIYKDMKMFGYTDFKILEISKIARQEAVNVSLTEALLL